MCCSASARSIHASSPSAVHCDPAKPGNQWRPSKRQKQTAADEQAGTRSSPESWGPPPSPPARARPAPSLPLTASRFPSHQPTAFARTRARASGSASPFVGSEVSSARLRLSVLYRRTDGSISSLSARWFPRRRFPRQRTSGSGSGGLLRRGRRQAVTSAGFPVEEGREGGMCRACVRTPEVQ